jgi:hypothetical protein
MSMKNTWAAVRNTMLALGMTALVSVVVHAADPNTAAKSMPAEVPIVPLSSGGPKSSAPRTSASLTRQTPFGEAIEVLRNSTTPPLKIIVLWKPLGDAGVYRDMPIGIDGLAGLRVSQCLELLLLSLSAGASAKLGYTVDSGVVTISSVAALPAPRPVIRLYDIPDLVAPPARYSLSSMGFGVGYGGPTAAGGGYAGSLGRDPAIPAQTAYRGDGRSPRNFPR